MPCGPVRKPETSRLGLEGGIGDLGAVEGFQAVAGRIIEGNQAGHAALVGQDSGFAFHRDGGGFQAGGELIEGCGACDFPAEDLGARLDRAVDEQPLLAIVHAERAHRAGAVHGCMPIVMWRNWPSRRDSMRRRRDNRRPGFPCSFLRFPGSVRGGERHCNRAFDAGASRCRGDRIATPAATLSAAVIPTAARIAGRCACRAHARRPAAWCAGRRSSPCSGTQPGIA